MQRKCSPDVVGRNEAARIAGHALDDPLEQLAIDGRSIQLGQTSRSVRCNEQTTAEAPLTPFELPAIPGAQLLVAIDDHERFPVPQSRFARHRRQRALAVVQSKVNHSTAGLRQLRPQRFQERRFAAAVRADDRPAPAEFREPRNEPLGIDGRRKEEWDRAGANKPRRERIAKSGGEAIVVMATPPGRKALRPIEILAPPRHPSRCEETPARAHTNATSPIPLRS